MGYLECARELTVLGYDFIIGKRYLIVEDRFQVVKIMTPIGRMSVSYEMVEDGVFKWVY